MQNTILSIKNLTKVFKSGSIFNPKEFVAVNDISFNLDSGEILGLLGPNGAGKTTTINMLLGLLNPTSGSIEYFGRGFSKHRSEIMLDVSFASSYVKMPGSLTVEENLNFYGKIYCLETAFRKKQIEKNLNIFGLEKIKSRLAKNLSAGQLTRLMLAKAFLPNPKIVLLDEPTAALDPDIALTIRKFILEQRNSLGVSILLTSHNMSEVQEMCDRIVVLKDGKILTSGHPDELAAKVRTSKVHLLVIGNLDKLINYVQEYNLNYKLDQNFIEIDVDEHKIADLIYSITDLKVQYAQISIDKPSLEDYFLEISK